MSRTAPTEAVVFDLDGTLVDSLPLVLQAISYAIEPFGPLRPTMEIFARLGGPPERFMPGLLNDPRDTPAALARMEKFHDENHHLILPFTGVHGMLEKLCHRDVPLAIWTGRDRETTDVLLEHHGLTTYFDTVVCGDDLPTHKPDAEGLREILLRVAVRPAHALFVGDADVDVLGGFTCQVDTVLIHHTREIEADILAKSWRLVTTPAEAYTLVLGCVGVE